MTVKNSPTVESVAPTTVDMIDKVALTKAKIEAQAELKKLTPVIQKLKITSEAEFQIVDEKRAFIKVRISYWTGKFKPAKQAINLLKSFITGTETEILQGYNQDLGICDDLMKNWQLEKLRKQRLVEAKAAEEQANLRAAADEKVRLSTLAKTPQVRSRLISQAAEIEVKAQEVITSSGVNYTSSSNSDVRSRVKWKNTDMLKYVRYVLLHPNLISTLMIDKGEMQALFKLQDNPKIGEWMPGIEIYDDVDIVSKRGSLK